MLIVDSQVHFWAANTPERPWPPGGHPQKPYPLGPHEMLPEMKQAGVDRIVIVPPLWEGHRNDYALKAAHDYPKQFAVMGRLDPALPAAPGAIKSVYNQPGMLGLRFAFHTPKLAEPLIDRRTDWIWKEAEEAGAPLYVLVPHSLMHLMDQIAQRHPRLKLVMDHMALTIGEFDADAYRDYDKLLAMAKYPNVAAKLSALPCYSKDKYPYRSLQPYIRQAYDAFGPRRLFWGSDFARSPISYRENVTMFTEEIPWLTSQDQEWIMGRGVCEWLGWNVA